VPKTFSRKFFTHFEALEQLGNEQACYCPIDHQKIHQKWMIQVRRKTKKNLLLRIFAKSEKDA
jgi:hypothetical protein